MSVAFALAVEKGMRAHGITVRFEPGWDRRGNGQTSAYIGGIVHHTATPFGRAPRILVNGRPDLSGPLCNSSGDDDGGITIIAAHPANHAGAASGSDARPFPNTRSFNKMVWGHETVYPGTRPMNPAQYRTAQILMGVICGICKHPNPNWARGHAETSITGKWDPGYAPGKTIDMDAFRSGIWAALNTAPALPTPRLGGDILKVYNGVPGLKALLGDPITEERGCPDGKGRYNHFSKQNGSIYWYPGLGAWEIHGEIKNKWASMGYERSKLGYPTSHEYVLADGGRRSNFQHGYIVWYSGKGATAVVK